MLEDKIIRQSQVIKVQDTDTTQDIATEGPQAGLPVLTIGYIQGVLKNLLGYLIEVDFLVGTESKVTKRGYLANVGVNFFIIYDVNDEMYVSCDMYSITFIYFGSEYDPQYIIPADFSRGITQPIQQ